MTPTAPEDIAIAELLHVLYVEYDAEPGSTSLVPVAAGHEVYMLSRSRGRTRIGVIPTATLEARIRSIRVARN